MKTTYEVRIAIATGKTRSMSGDLTAANLTTLDAAKQEVKELYDGGHAALAHIYRRWYDQDGNFHYTKVAF